MLQRLVRILVIGQPTIWVSTIEPARDGIQPTNDEVWRYCAANGIGAKDRDTDGQILRLQPDHPQQDGFEVFPRYSRASVGDGSPVGAYLSN